MDELVKTKMPHSRTCGMRKPQLIPPSFGRFKKVGNKRKNKD
jgi:hypothetical protein